MWARSLVSGGLVYRDRQRGDATAEEVCDYTCRWCGGERESLHHLAWECPRFEEQRRRRYDGTTLQEIRGAPPALRLHGLLLVRSRPPWEATVLPWLLWIVLNTLAYVGQCNRWNEPEGGEGVEKADHEDAVEGVVEAAHVQVRGRRGRALGRGRGRLKKTVHEVAPGARPMRAEEILERTGKKRRRGGPDESWKAKRARGKAAAAEENAEVATARATRAAEESREEVAEAGRGEQNNGGRRGGATGGYVC